MRIYSTLIISAIAASYLFGADNVNLGKVTVQNSAIKTEVTDVSGKDLKSADLADAEVKEKII